MAYKLGGKFVSKAAFEAAQKNNSTEETPVSEDFETASVDTETAADKRRGQRPTTVYKQAANRKTAAEVKLLKAQKKLSGFDNGRDELLIAVEDAKAEVAAADDELSAAADAL